MDFEEIEELNEEDMNVLYNDIVEFGDETHVAGCCCASGRRDYVTTTTSYSCYSWCRALGSSCSGWTWFSSPCSFSCQSTYPSPIIPHLFMFLNFYKQHILRYFLQSRKQDSKEHLLLHFFIIENVKIMYLTLTAG